MRADAMAGWTLKQCALRRGFNIYTVQKHAKLHKIVFRYDPLRQDPLPGSANAEAGLVKNDLQQQKDARRLLARLTLQREIQAAKAEASTAPLYEMTDERDES